MELHHFATGPELLARGGEFLRRREIAHNMLVSVANRLAAPPAAAESAPYLATVEEDGRVVAVAVCTPPHQLLLSHAAPEVLPGALDRVIDDLRARAVALPGVGGPVGVADVFAERWAHANGVTARRLMAMREFELERVAPPAPVPGELRAATAGDLDLVHAWVHAFIDETGLPPADREAAKPAMIADRIAQGRFWLWEEGGGPRVLAGSGGTPRVGRIGPVYTPPEQRRRGYASALVAALSQRLLDDGCWRVTLSTDLANPTSNRIYQRLGYRPVGDSVMMTFEP